MELVGSGSKQAFEVLFDRHSGAAFSLALRMCGRRAAAEDVVQDAFVSIWRSGRLYDRTRGTVRSWVLSTVHNRAIDSFRRSALREDRTISDEGLADRLEGPDRTDALVEDRERSRAIRAALETLPFDQRRVIELAYFGGFSHAEIAQQLSLAPGTVKGRLRLGLEKLRGALSDLPYGLT